jgi:hypothetical protein
MSPMTIDCRTSASMNPIAKPRWNAAFALSVLLQKNSIHQSGMSGKPTPVSGGSLIRASQMLAVNNGTILSTH